MIEKFAGVRGEAGHHHLYLRPLPAAVRARGGMARAQSPRPGRWTGEACREAGAGLQEAGGLERILAAAWESWRQAL